MLENIGMDEGTVSRLSPLKLLYHATFPALIPCTQLTTCE
jgi:hypothetical protein